jgi:hypothetical protein
MYSRLVPQAEADVGAVRQDRHIGAVDQDVQQPVAEDAGTEEEGATPAGVEGGLAATQDLIGGGEEERPDQGAVTLTRGGCAARRPGCG